MLFGFMPGHGVMRAMPFSSCPNSRKKKYIYIYIYIPRKVLRWAMRSLGIDKNGLSALSKLCIKFQDLVSGCGYGIHFPVKRECSSGICA